MHKLGLNNAILLTFRDGRYNKFHESILGTIETSLFRGPIWFNCFQDITINLKESYNGPILVLNTKLYGYDMKLGTIAIIVIYRVQYKLHNSTYSRV